VAVGSAHLIVCNGHLLLHEADQPHTDFGRVVAAEDVAHEPRLDLELDLKIIRAAQVNDRVSRGAFEQSSTL
jgi:hypothetical protein